MKPLPNVEMMTAPLRYIWANKFAFATILTGLLATSMTVAVALPFFDYPPGTAYRAMGFSVALFAATFAALGAAILGTVCAILFDRNRWWLVPAIVVCLIPFPLGIELQILADELLDLHEIP